MKVYVLVETEPVYGSEVIGVFAKKEDALKLMFSRYDAAIEDNPDAADDPHTYTDHNGGCVGDPDQPDGWIYWDVEPHEVWGA